ncbi:MAG: hypothetical protein V7676_07620 [Parasphingorhabdus sp.]|uniref:hypothetical protein n=1 Tax=Parasphingorhabdus sp. TaxID=2709688 RepID=UPI003001A9E7
MRSFIKMPLTAIAIVALSACAASEAPAAEPDVDSADTETADTVTDASKPAVDHTKGGQSQRVTIAGFECGDNCYLDYSPFAQPDSEAGDMMSALCSVDLCSDWFSDQAMPPEFIGRTATIVVKLGKQYDNEGNVMSDDFPEIVSLVVEGE